jgi:hypothetical protein
MVPTALGLVGTRNGRSETKTTHLYASVGVITIHILIMMSDFFVCIESCVVFTQCGFPCRSMTNDISI